MWWNCRRRIAGVGILVGFAAPISVVASPASQRPAEVVQSNDNRHQAGTLAFGTLWLRIRAAEGTWRPEGPDGPGLSIEALGEESGLALGALAVHSGFPKAHGSRPASGTSCDARWRCTGCARRTAPPASARRRRAASERATSISTRAARAPTTTGRRRSGRRCPSARWLVHSSSIRRVRSKTTASSSSPNGAA